MCKNTVSNSLDLIKFADHKAVSISNSKFHKFLSVAGRERASTCASFLIFTRWRHMTNSEQKIYSLSSANFCKHRLCAMCAWRHSVRTCGELMAKINMIKKNYSAIFVTLTVRNCEMKDLKATVKKMAKAWHKFIKMKEIQKMNFAWFRAIEFLGDHTKQGEAHPHYHVLMLVNRSYFTSRDYLSQERMQALWRKALTDDNDGIVNIKKVKGEIISAVSEVAKYTQKSSSVEAMSDDDLRIFMDQIRGVRKFAFGGLLRELEPETEDLSEFIKEAIERYIFKSKSKAYIFDKNIPLS